MTVEEESSYTLKKKKKKKLYLQRIYFDGYDESVRSYCRLVSYRTASEQKRPCSKRLSIRLSSGEFLIKVSRFAAFLDIKSVQILCIFIKIVCKQRNFFYMSSICNNKYFTLNVVHYVHFWIELRNSFILTKQCYNKTMKSLIIRFSHEKDFTLFSEMFEFL